jgi:hypothetical protein
VKMKKIINPIIVMLIILLLIVIVSCSNTDSPTAPENNNNKSFNLNVSGSSGTLVADVGSKPYIELDPGTYNVSLSGSGIKLFTAQPSPDKYIILWTANNNRHFFIEQGTSQTITFSQNPTHVYTFLVDVNSVDSSGELEIKFAIGSTTKTLNITGQTCTLVADVGSMPNVMLDPGSYQVGVSGNGIKLFTAQPSPYKYIILWTANNNRHFFIETGKSQSITFNQSPTPVYAFLVDVNRVDSSGSLEVEFVTL